MTVFRKPTKKLRSILLLAAALMVVPHPTEAGVKKIWPDKFIPWNNAQNSKQYPYSAASNSGSSVYFYANLKLPVGAEIRKLVYFHYGTGTPQTLVLLQRQKLGKESDPLYLLGSSSEDNSSQIIKVPSGPPIANADMIVRKGYRYFLTIFSKDGLSEIWGIKVFYR